MIDIIAVLYLYNCYVMYKGSYKISQLVKEESYEICHPVCPGLFLDSDSRDACVTVKSHFLLVDPSPR